MKFRWKTGHPPRPALSLPLQSAWIEICILAVLVIEWKRGLKYLSRRHRPILCRSLPLREVWIEITATSRTPARSSGRSPHGGRGLKYPQPGGHQRDKKSPPSRGAWIEIAWMVRLFKSLTCRPHAGVWIGFASRGCVPVRRPLLLKRAAADSPAPAGPCTAAARPARWPGRTTA